MSFDQLDQNMQHLDMQFLNAIGEMAARSAHVDIAERFQLGTAPPVSAITCMFCALAALTALITFLLVPLVVMVNRQSPGRPWASM